jgi:protein subunit release factor B
MSFFPDIAPLTKEVQQFNQSQTQIIALLQEQNQLLKQIAQQTKDESQETSNYRRSPRTLDTDQLEYSVKQMFVYGTIAAAAITLGVTYTYLLIQKIKA